MSGGKAAKRPSSDERASPWQRPRPCQIGGPGAPFRMVIEDADDNIKDIHALHLGPKPLALKTSKR